MSRRPSKIGTILDLTTRELEQILYCESYVVLDAKNTDLEVLLSAAPAEAAVLFTHANHAELRCCLDDAPCERRELHDENLDARKIAPQHSVGQGRPQHVLIEGGRSTLQLDEQVLDGARGGAQYACVPGVPGVPGNAARDEPRRRPRSVV